MQRACKSKNRSKDEESAVGRVGEEEEELDSDDSNDSALCQVESKGVVPPPIQVKVKLDDCVVNMEVDTGAAMSLMSETTFQGLWPGRDLQPSQVRLCAYTKERFLLWDVATSTLSTMVSTTTCCGWFRTYPPG